MFWNNTQYPAVPILSQILRIAAVLFFLFGLYLAISGFGAAFRSWSAATGLSGAPVTGFGPRLESLLSPLYTLVQNTFLAALLWGFAELFSIARDILLTMRAPRETLPEPDTE